MAETLLKDIRYALALDAPQPRVFGRRHPVAGPRRRRQHRDVLAGRLAAVPAAAGDVARHARRRLHHQRRRRRIRHHLLPGLPRPQGAEHRLQRHDRLQPDDGAAQPRRSLAHRARPGRHVESLRDARRAAVPRPPAACRPTTIPARRAWWCISHRMWQREFGSDPAIVGKTLHAARPGRTRSPASRRRRSPASCRC